MEIINGKIGSTMLGVEDHGIMSFFLHLEFDGSGQGFGGYALDQWDETKKRRVGTAFGLECIQRILDTVGVEKWEDLKGKYIRVKKASWSSPITAIGHIIDNKWYDIEAHATEYKGK
jgi:hypothetical protein